MLLTCQSAEQDLNLGLLRLNPGFASLEFLQAHFDQMVYHGPF